MKANTAFRFFITFTVFPFAFCISLSAQIEAGISYLDKGDLAAAKTAFENSLQGNRTEKVAAEYYLGIWYSSAENPDLSLEKAYQYAKSSSAAFKELKPGQQENLKGWQVTSGKLAALSRNILAQARQNCSTLKSMPCYESLLADFELSTAPRREVLREFYPILLTAVSFTNRYETLAAWMEKYGKEMKTIAPDSYRQLEDKVFESFIAANGWAAYNDYKTKYPQSVYSKDLAAAKFVQLKTSNAPPADFENFIKNNPNSAFLPFAKAMYQEAPPATPAISSTNAEYNDHNWNSFEVLQSDFSKDIDAKQWQKALEKAKLYESKLKNNPRYQEMIGMLSATDRPVKKVPISSKINSTGSEFAPVITADGETLYFTGKSRKDGVGLEDVFMVKKINGEWAEPQLVEALSLNKSNDSPLAVTADGNGMFIFRDGALLFSTKTFTGWSEPVAPPFNTGETGNVYDAILSADGQAFIFVAPNFSNGKDIMISLKQTDGSWGMPFSIGESINTPQEERTPFLHPDMKTLYFSSDGHGGFGSLDVFKTTRKDSTWTNWEMPINLGREFNTTGSDWGYVVHKDGQKAFFSTEIGIQEDIFEVDLPQELRPLPVSTVSGVVKGLKAGESAKVIVRDVTTGKLIGEFTTEPGTNKYFIIVPIGATVAVNIEKDSVISAPVVVNTKEEKNQAIVEDITVVDLSKGCESSITFKDLLFDTDQYQLKAEFTRYLDEIALQIANLDCTVVIEGHTDNVGDDNYNLKLSTRRAEAVKHYLISKGCQQSKLKSKGFGEAKPIANNEEEIGKAQNRRVEIRFMN